MGVISIENVNRLYWLGRYSERVYTTIRLFSDSFDELIDQDLNSFAQFCEKIDIPNIYENGDDFVEKYCFDETNPDSIISNLTRAYDNGIELREEIGSEPLSYIQLALYSMKKAHMNPAPLIEMQKVIDDILAFWGIADDMIESENVRNIIKVGKRIERIDLYSRLGAGRSSLLREVHRLQGRIGKTNLVYDNVAAAELSALAEAPVIDYYRIVSIVENLVEA